MITVEHLNHVPEEHDLKQICVFNFNYPFKKRIEVVLHYVIYESTIKGLVNEIGIWKVKKLHKTLTVLN